MGSASTVTASDEATVAVLRRAARRAAAAWSVVQTQPWRFELQPSHLDLIADHGRRLEALDASGRSQLLSLGAALYAARVALAAAGCCADVERLPEPSRSGLIARVALGKPPCVVEPLAADEALLRDQVGEASGFTSGAVPEPALAAIREAARREGIDLAVVPAGQAHPLLDLCRDARDIQLIDSTCRAELRAWTGAAAREPEYRDDATAPAVLVLGSAHDDRLQWVRTGEALQRVLIAVARHGLVASTAPCALEVPITRVAVREQLQLDWYPHVIVRIGQGAAPAAPLRRRLVDVLFEPN
jgi:hypothetical protein